MSGLLRAHKVLGGSGNERGLVAGVEKLIAELGVAWERLEDNVESSGGGGLQDENGDRLRMSVSRLVEIGEIANEKADEWGLYG